MVKKMATRKSDHSEIEHFFNFYLKLASTSCTVFSTRDTIL